MTGRRAAAAGGRAQGAYEIFEDTDAPGVAQCLQPHEHRFTVHQMILTDPASDLVVVGIQLRPAAGTRLRLGRAAHIATHRVPRDPQFAGDRPHWLAPDRSLTDPVYRPNPPKLPL